MVDMNTATHQRGKFARMCVGIDLEKPFVAQYRIEGTLHNIEYEGLHLICFSCGKYGHDRDHCSLKSEGHHQEVRGSGAQKGPEEALAQSIIQDKDNTASTMEDTFGPWMLVQRQIRPRRQTKGGPMTEEKSQKSNQQNSPDSMRFGVLYDLDKSVGENLGVEDVNKDAVPNVGAENKEHKKEFVKGSQMRREKAQKAIP